MSKCVYTIGHSNHAIEKFLELLALHEIAVVADVRSSPYSRFTSQFNRENLQAELRNLGLQYVFLGRELGARTEEEQCYVEGRVDYNRLAKTDLFQSGMKRVIKGVLSHRVALMCAEKDPLTCHRAILVCRHLAACGIESQHILEDGQIESHSAAIARLRKELGLPGRDLFRSQEEIIADAYDERGRQIAYTQSRESDEEMEGIDA